VSHQLRALHIDVSTVAGLATARSPL
jgi:hypothetical protein